MKILSWNILQGGGRRLGDIILSIKNHNPDILVLSEYRNGKTGAALRSKLEKEGFIHQYYTGIEKSVNSVLIASRVPCQFKNFIDQIEIFPENIIAAEFDQFVLYGMYLPHKKKHNLFDFLLTQIQESTKPCILAGDFNTGINFIDQKGSSFWYSEYLLKFIQNKYIDAFRFVNDDLKEYSWFSHQGNGFRYDHIWCHVDLLQYINDCNYSHEERIARISDHSIMLLDLDVNV